MRQNSTSSSIQWMREVPELVDRHPPRATGARALGLALIAFALGCEAPTVQLADCEAVCGSGACPDGLDCRAGYCVHPSMVGFCDGPHSTGGQAGAATGRALGGAASAAGGNQGSSDGGSNWGSAGSSGALIALSGNAGTATAEPGGSGGAAGCNTEAAGAAGVAEWGGEVGMAGMGGTGPVSSLGGGAGVTPGGMGGCGAAVLPLRIQQEPALPKLLCTDQHYSSLLTVTGVGTDYAWEANPFVAGMTLDATSGTTTRLDFLPTQIGKIAAAFRVSNECGAGELGLEVVASPSVTTRALATACIDESYQVQLNTLAASADDEWHGKLPSELGLTLSPDGKLTGTLRKAGSYAIEVWVQNRKTGCLSATVRLALTVENDSSVVCPRIGIKGMPAAVEAPDACDGWPYKTEVTVKGGTAPYVWSAVELPPGVVFDSTTQVVSGVVSAVGTMLLQVTDGNGHAIQRRFAIARRDKCWLSYLSDETGQRRLHLVDPQLGHRLRRPVSDASDLSVADYKFSPNGRFLAYRVKDATSAYKLWLWQGPGWDHDQELNLGGSVTHYEWSSDGAVLAASAENTDGTWLGGFDVSKVPMQSPVGNIQGLGRLTPVAAAVHSEITWYGHNSYVVYHSLFDPAYDYRVFNRAKYSPLGFTEMYRGSDWYSTGVSFRPSDYGFFVADSDASLLDFYAIGREDTIFHDNVAIAPDGDLVAIAANERLNVYLATAISAPPTDPTFAVANGCSHLLAWAKQQSLIACVDSVTQLVRVFSIHPDASIGTSAILNSSAMAKEEWRAHQRRLSTTGKWLAFAADAHLYLGDLSRTPPEIVSVTSLQPGQPVGALQFAPDERLLSIHRGKDILVQELTPNGAFDGKLVNLAATMSVAESCQDRWLAGVDWCGNDVIEPSTWSADSNSVAFVRGDGRLMVADLRLRPISVIPLQEVLTSCGAGCLGSQRFQP